MYKDGLKKETKNFSSDDWNLFLSFLDMNQNEKHKSYDVYANFNCKMKSFLIIYKGLIWVKRSLRIWLIIYLVFRPYYC